MFSNFCYYHIIFVVFLFFSFVFPSFPGFDLEAKKGRMKKRKKEWRMIKMRETGPKIRYETSFSLYFFCHWVFWGKQQTNKQQNNNTTKTTTHNKQLPTNRSTNCKYPLWRNDYQNNSVKIILCNCPGAITAFSCRAPENNSPNILSCKSPCPVRAPPRSLSRNHRDYGEKGLLQDAKNNSPEILLCNSSRGSHRIFL